MADDIEERETLMKKSEIRRWRIGNLCWVCDLNILCKAH